MRKILLYLIAFIGLSCNGQTLLSELMKLKEQQVSPYAKSITFKTNQTSIFGGFFTGNNLEKNWKLDGVNVAYPIDLSSNTGEAVIKLEYNGELTNISITDSEISEIDVSKSTELKRLSIVDAKISSIDLSNNTELEYLDLSKNQITNIDLSHNTKVESLGLGNNDIFNLDINNLTNLKIIAIGKNNISQLNINNNAKLEEVYVNDNQLTSINTSNQTLLKRLNASRNPINSIDLFSNNALLYLNIRECLFASAPDLSNNIGLIELRVGGQDIINVPHLNLLSDLEIADLDAIKATSFDFSANTKLRDINISNNLLSSQSIDNVFASLLPHNVNGVKIDYTNQNENYPENIELYEAALSANYDLIGNSPKDWLRLVNFHVKNEYPDRIYFATSRIVNRGETVTGLYLGDGTEKSITGISLNTGNCQGHYFTVDTPFTYWDNYAIRYEGGADIGINLLGGGVKPVPKFTLSYIDNQIEEPEAATERFVATTATGSGDGTSPLSPWTIQQAFNNATAGMTVWIKAGDYGNVNLTVSNHGTPESPIKFIGFKQVKGDILNNYYNPEAENWSTTEMPTLTGVDRTNGNGIILQKRNIIIKNLQVTNYQRGIRSNLANVYNNVIENCNFKTFGNSSGSGNGTGIGYQYWRTSGRNIRIKDVVVKNATLHNIQVSEHNVSILNTISYSDESNGRGDVGLTTDYHISINGDNPIIYNSKVFKNTNNGDGHLQHGFVFKAIYNSSDDAYYGVNYGLIENCEAIGIKGSYELRWGTVRNCVIKNSIAHADIPNRRMGSSNDIGTGGFEISNGAHHNIIENCYVHDVDHLVEFQDNGEYPPDRSMANHNIFRNIKVENVLNVIQANVTSSNLNANPTGNKFYNMTIGSATRMFFMRDNTNGFSFDSSNEVINTIVRNVENERRGNNVVTGWNFKNSAFFGDTGDWSANSQSGDGNIVANPKLDSNLKPTQNTPNSITEGGQDLDTVLFDYDWRLRVTPYSIGCFEKN